MANPFPYESFQWLWYEYWIPVAAAGVAIFALTSIWGTTKQGLYSSFIRVFAVLGALSTIPLASERIDMGVSGNEDVMLLMSVGGAITGLTLLWFHMVILLSGKRGQKNNMAYAVAGHDSPDLTSDFGGYKDFDDFFISLTGRQLRSDFGGYKAADDLKTNVGAVPKPAASPVKEIPVMEDTTIIETKPRTTGAWVTVQSGESTGQVLGITNEITRIGRSSDNHLVLSDTTVSRSHAVIRKSGNSYEIADLGSSGGTTVNGERVSGASVTSGNTIKVGQTELLVTNVEMAENLPATHPKSDDTMVATPSKTKFVLLCKSGPQAGTSFSVVEGVSTLGRDVSSDVQISDSAVSRKHATLSVRSGKLTINDEGSRGGTFVNGQRMSGTKLNNDDSITLGNVRLTFVRPAQS